MNEIEYKKIACQTCGKKKVKQSEAKFKPKCLDCWKETDVNGMYDCKRCRQRRVSLEGRLCRHCYRQHQRDSHEEWQRQKQEEDYPQEKRVSAVVRPDYFSRSEHFEKLI